MSHDEKAALETLLRAGYGVEDAALAMGVPVSELRAQVALWRADGTLRRWWPQ